MGTPSSTTPMKIRRRGQRKRPFCSSASLIRFSSVIPLFRFFLLGEVGQYGPKKEELLYLKYPIFQNAIRIILYYLYLINIIYILLIIDNSNCFIYRAGLGCSKSN